MSKTENLRALLNIGAEMNSTQIEERFKEIALALFNDFAIQKGTKKYLFKEIEFYFYNHLHRDIITHPRLSKALYWYVNDFGGIDLNFGSNIAIREKDVKGKSKTKFVLDDKAFFGGILIRQLVSIDGSETLDGPWACAELFRCFDAINQSTCQPLIVEYNSGMSAYLKGERIRLIRGKQSIPSKVDYILSNYDEHPDRSVLCEDFSRFMEKPYRFIRCDSLMHDRDTDEVYLSKWLMDEKEGHKDFYERLTDLLKGIGIKVKELEGTSDYWARDYMPIQMGRNEYVKYRYYPDYLVRSKNPKDKDTITDCAKVLQGMGINCRSTKLVIDGGNMVPCGPYVVMTDKVFTENGHAKGDAVFKSRLEMELGHPVIIIPWTLHGDFDSDDTDKYGHSDGFIKWCGGNRILMGNHGDCYPEEADAIRHILEGYGFIVTEIRFKDKVACPKEEYNWAYINFLQVGNKIIMPKFNIEEDSIALKYIHEAFPDCEVHQIEMSDIVKEGGALHCLCWNIARSPQSPTTL